MRGRLFVISSPSGGGKTTLVERLMERLPHLRRSVSLTTRPPREGERDGEDYHFVTEGDFARRAQEGALLEWAEVHGRRYGTPRGPIEKVLEKGEAAILCIDVQGARSVRQKLGDEAVLIFLMPPSMEALKERLRKRDTETEEALRIRMEAAERELACASWYDHRVVNDDLDHAVDQVAGIIARTVNASSQGGGHDS